MTMPRNGVVVASRGRVFQALGRGAYGALVAGRWQGPRSNTEISPMATIWFCRDGRDPTVGDHRAKLSISECEKGLGLNPAMFHGGPDKRPRFNEDSKMEGFTAPKYVVIEIEDSEAGEQWKAGFYVTPLSPMEADRYLASKGA